MAGFFGLFDYTKEGKGVYPDDPQKGPLALFFSVLGRKFWKICTINLMYILFSLPAIALSMLGGIYLTAALIPGLTLENLTGVIASSGLTLAEGVTTETAAASQMMMVNVLMGMLVFGLSLSVIGPVHAGVTYLLRNYSREEHAFVWMDFKDHAKKNWKQSTVSCLISIGVTLLFVVNFSFYSQSTFIANELLRTALQTFIVILFLLWCIMQMYLYPMMVTFNLGLKQLYRNSLLFSVLRLPLNLLILVLSILIVFVIPAVLLLLGYGITILLAVLWYLAFAFAFNLLLTNFFVYRGLDKYMIQRLQATEDIENEDDKTESAADEDGQEEEQPEVGKGEEDPEHGGLVEAPSGIHA